MDNKEQPKYRILDMFLKTLVVLVCVTFLVTVMYFMINTVQLKKKQLESDVATREMLKQVATAQTIYFNEPLLRIQKEEKIKE